MQQPKQQEIRNPQPQYQHPQSITEPNTLQLISTINKREWENSELKVTLAKSQETYSNLMNYTNQLLETVKSHQEQSMKQMQEKVKNIQTSNEILENAVNQKVSYLADSIRKDIVNTVSERLSSSIKNNKEMITNFSNAQLKHMERIGEGYRRNQENFLEIQGVKNTLFWIFAGSWLIWALNFIWNLILTFI
ncbi:MAG: hypothetical protein FWF57_01270 [Defluviitaleaceae bacterium]|nr:hypothetical protein [Defluviitaleaceae bacterium]